MDITISKRKTFVNDPSVAPFKKLNTFGQKKRTAADSNYTPVLLKLAFYAYFALVLILAVVSSLFFNVFKAFNRFVGESKLQQGFTD